MLTVNASNIDKDWAWVTEHGRGPRSRNASAETGLIAVQGPRAEALVGRLADRDVTTIGYYRFARGAVAGVPALISRTGYTGEDGFELYVAAGATARLWTALVDAGRADGVAPIGLGARDTLRLEMKYALYGNDIDDTTNALEAGLGWVVKPAKGDFIGREALGEIRSNGLKRKLCCMTLDDPTAVIMGKEPIFAPGGGGAHHDAPVLGYVTSANHGYTVRQSIAFGYLPVEYAAEGSKAEIYYYGNHYPTTVRKEPLYDPENTKLKA